MTFEVRSATPNDIDRLHEQCRQQAAAHEGMLQYFTVTKADLREQMDKPHVRILVIVPTKSAANNGEEDNMALKTLAGHLIAVYFVDGTGQRCADYASLFVAKEFRGKGLATALLGEASKLARREGATSAEILVQSTGSVGAARLDMYRHYGFENHNLLHNCRVYELYPDDHEAVLRLAESRRSEIDTLHVTTEAAAIDGRPGGAVFDAHTLTVRASGSSGNDVAKFGFHHSFCPVDGRSIDMTSMWFAEDVDVGLILLAMTSCLLKKYRAKLLIALASVHVEPVRKFLTELMFEDITEQEDWNVLELPTNMLHSLAERKLRDDIRSQID